MGAKQVVIGLLIFIFVTISLFLCFYYIFTLNEPVSVLIAVIGGLGAEIVYRRKKARQ